MHEIVSMTVTSKSLKTIDSYTHRETGVVIVTKHVLYLEPTSSFSELNQTLLILTEHFYCLNC